MIISTFRKNCCVLMYLVVAEHSLELILEGKVKSLSGEITEHIGQVTTPQGDGALFSHDALEAVTNTLVRLRQTTGLQHLILLFLNKGLGGKKNGG